jgi:nucleoside phosphorylase
VVDEDPKSYSASVLIEMKARHELQIHDRLSKPDSQLPVLGHTAATQLARQVDPSVADIAIITAVRVELDAILEYFPTLEKVTVGDDSRTYYQGIVVAHDGITRYRVVATLLRDMGNLQAASATAELIQDWSPRYVVMCGIAGGLGSGQQLGDVVVSTDVIYYELAKIREDGIERRPVFYRADSLLVDRAMHMHLGTSWRARLPPRPDHGSPNAAFPAVHFAPIASGDKVIASATDAKHLLALHPKLAAVEMEGGGVATSAFATARRIGFFMVRAICDFADRNKGDSWHRFAAHAAASFLSELLATRPIAPSEGAWVPLRERRESREQGVDSQWIRSVFFPKMCQSLNMEEFQDFCYVLQIDADDLKGASKRAKIRELLLRAERRGRLHEIVKAYEQFLDEDW